MAASPCQAPTEMRTKTTLDQQWAGQENWVNGANQVSSIAETQAGRDCRRSLSTSGRRLTLQFGGDDSLWPCRGLVLAVDTGNLPNTNGQKHTNDGDQSEGELFHVVSFVWLPHAL